MCSYKSNFMKLSTGIYKSNCYLICEKLSIYKSNVNLNKKNCVARNLNLI